MTTISDTQLERTSREARRHRNDASQRSLQEFLKEGFRPSAELAQYLNDKESDTVGTRDFGVWVDAHRPSLETSELTVIKLVKESRCDHSLVYVYNETTRQGGLAELQEKGDMLTPMSISEIRMEFGDDVVADLARAVANMKDADALLARR